LTRRRPAVAANRDPSGAVGLRAWAKVNLYLEITGRRGDGYHELDSLVAFAGVGDRLDFEPAERLSLTVRGPFADAVPHGPENLVLRAAEALAAQAGRPAGARISLDKQLPAAAGIGGGSADAAATLAGLAALWGLDSDPGALARIAGALGADVPVCLFGRPALVRGVGERIQRAPPLPAAWLLLVNPGVPLATAAVFAARRGDYSRPAAWPGVAPDAATLATWLAEHGNDLEAPARRLAPDVERVLTLLAEQDGVLLARMSGSGATCFGLFADSAAARQAAAVIGRSRDDWWLAAAPLLHGDPDRPAAT